jgi:hypothetical protein
MAAFQYAAKFVCGKSDGEALAPGVYFTAINVHNPTARDVTFRKKFALPGREPEKSGNTPKKPVSADLRPDAALEIDCPDIREHTGVDEVFLKGFVVLESDVELDVVAVYTAAGGDGRWRRSTPSASRRGGGRPGCPTSYRTPTHKRGSASATTRGT